MTQMNLSTKETHRHRTDLWLPGRRGTRGGMDWESGISRGKLYRMDNKVLLYSTRNYIQYPG